MAKHKKKKNGGKKGKVGASALDTFKSLGNNTLVADVVAAALVATAAALKDPNKARRFASEAGDQLEKLSKDGVERGGAMWQLALNIGRRALDSVGAEGPAKAKRAKAKTAVRAKAPAKRKAPAKPKVIAKPKAAAKPKVTKAKSTKAKVTAAAPKVAAKPKARRPAKKKA